MNNYYYWASPSDATYSQNYPFINIIIEEPHQKQVKIIVKEFPRAAGGSCGWRDRLGGLVQF